MNNAQKTKWNDNLTSNKTPPPLPSVPGMIEQSLWTLLMGETTDALNKLKFETTSSDN